MKIKLRLPIEVGKTYYTKDGRKVRIYATNSGGVYPVHGAYLMEEEWIGETWTSEGQWLEKEENDLDITHEEWEPADKELVWTWDDNQNLGRQLRFYDAKNNKEFNSFHGTRGSRKYDNYAPYEGEWPEWAKEAYKKLED